MTDVIRFKQSEIYNMNNAFTLKNVLQKKNLDFPTEVKIGFQFYLN